MIYAIKIILFVISLVGVFLVGGSVAIEAQNEPDFYMARDTLWFAFFAALNAIAVFI